MHRQQQTWQIDGLVPQKEAPGDASAVPCFGEGQDLTQPSHVVLEGGRADVTHGWKAERWKTNPVRWESGSSHANCQKNSQVNGAEKQISSRYVLERFCILAPSDWKRCRFFSSTPQVKKLRSITTELRRLEVIFKNFTHTKRSKGLCRVKTRGKKTKWEEKQGGNQLLTGDVDERGVNFAAFGGNEALDEGGTAAAPHPRQADLHELQVNAQGVFSPSNWRRFLIHGTFKGEKEKKNSKSEDSQTLISNSRKTHLLIKHSSENVLQL